MTQVCSPLACNKREENIKISNEKFLYYYLILIMSNYIYLFICFSKIKFRLVLFTVSNYCLEIIQLELH